MRWFLIPINRMILLHKRGNGQFSMSDCVCVDGMTRVHSFYLSVTDISRQILLAWESYQYLVLNSKYWHLRTRCNDLPPSMATTLYRFYPSLYRPYPFRWCVSSPRMGTSLSSLLHHGPVLP